MTLRGVAGGAGGGGGTVEDVSVVTANGLAGTVATSTTTPAITLSTTVTGILSGNGTAISAASTTGSGSVVLATSPTLVTPALGTPTALVGTNITGTASGLTAGHVTTNANLTGPITSVGNATSIASQTGTGTKFVVDTSPTLVTPNLGTPSAATLTNATGLPVSSGITGLGSGVATMLASATGAVLPITAVFNGGGSAIPANSKGDLYMTFACTITAVTLLADQSGAIVIDIWKDTLANYPPTVADTITASAKPTIAASGTNSQDTTLTGWTTAIAAGTTLRFNVDSCTSITRCTLVLTVVKT